MNHDMKFAKRFDCNGHGLIPHLLPQDNKNCPSSVFEVTTTFLIHSERTQELENSNLSVGFLGSFLSFNKNEKTSSLSVTSISYQLITAWTELQ